MSSVCHGEEGRSHGRHTSGVRYEASRRIIIATDELPRANTIEPAALRLIEELVDLGLVAVRRCKSMSIAAGDSYVRSYR